MPLGNLNSSLSLHDRKNLTSYNTNAKEKKKEKKQKNTSSYRRFCLKKQTDLSGFHKIITNLDFVQHLCMPTYPTTKNFIYLDADTEKSNERI